ncbi:hypothetical protein HK102_006736 [Quaeritorhiza haematococci]|nr:hypothetical protein HK102_006736 [Quaeritorhiza haematococci]
MFNSATGDEFIVKGIAYQPGGSALASDGFDPISDASKPLWSRDLEIMKSLGLNTIRVYEVDPNVSHDQFMKALSDSNMYLLLDLGKAKSSVNRDDPASTWNAGLVERYKLTLRNFAKYDNVLGFVVGNEVANSVATTRSAAYVKSLLRELKEYQFKQLWQSRNTPTTNPTTTEFRRVIPLGYVASDDATIRRDSADFFNCGDDPMERADFYGVNLYSWCGADANYVTSHYIERVADFRDYSIPVIIAEYGCNTIRPRVFTERLISSGFFIEFQLLGSPACQVNAIYSQPMIDVFSGAIVFEYSEESNGYGLMRITGDLKAAGGGQTTITPLSDFFNFRTAIASVGNVSTAMTLDTPKERRPHSTCPMVSPTWHASAELPAVPIA